MGVLEMEEGTEESVGSVPVRVRVMMRWERLLCWWMSVAHSALLCMPTCTKWTTSPGQWAGLGGGRVKRCTEGFADLVPNIKSQGFYCWLFVYRTHTILTQQYLRMHACTCTHTWRIEW